MFVLAIDSNRKEMGWAMFSGGVAHQGLDAVNQTKVPSPTFDACQDENVETQGPWTLVKTGAIVIHDRARPGEVSARIENIEAELNRMAEDWPLQEVACGKPSPIRFPGPRQGIEMLDSSLKQWARWHDLPLHFYTHREIVKAILGRANAARADLAYAMMTRWSLLGIVKTTREWNAIAVGDYHLTRQQMAVSL